MTTIKKPGRTPWVVAKVIANLDQRRKNMLDALLAFYREKEPRTSQTNVMERALEALYEKEGLTTN